MDEPSVASVLETRRSDLVRELASLTQRPPNPAGNLSFGKRIGDGTTEAVDRINTTAAARSLAGALGDVDRALVKLAEGTYGRCDVCERRIPAERLAAVPWTAYCVSCSSRRSR